MRKTNRKSPSASQEKAVSSAHTGWLVYVSGRVLWAIYFLHNDFFSFSYTFSFFLDNSNSRNSCRKESWQTNLNEYQAPYNNIFGHSRDVGISGMSSLAKSSLGDPVSGNIISACVVDVYWAWCCGMSSKKIYQFLSKITPFIFIIQLKEILFTWPPGFQRKE